MDVSGSTSKSTTTTRHPARPLDGPLVQEDSGRSGRVVRRSSDWYPTCESATHTGSFSCDHFQSFQLSAGWGGELAGEPTLRTGGRYSSNIDVPPASRACGASAAASSGGGDDDESASRRDDRDRDRPLQVSSSTSSFTTMIFICVVGRQLRGVKRRLALPLCPRRP